MILAIPLVLLAINPAQALESLRFAAGAVAHTSIFIAFAVFAVAYMKATGAESLLARAFEGPQLRMVIMAALLGGLSPFCSCEVIPFIAAMLGMGVPLAAVMAFWLSSPLMDPAMFSITAGELGLPFALAKTVAAVSLGVFGGLAVLLLNGTRIFADPLKANSPIGGCCGARKAFTGQPEWRFWQHQDRRATFKATVLENAVFLLKWLTLAYLIESLMIAYVPAEWIAGVLGGDGFQPVLIGALVGMPAYLNGYAAVGLLDGLLDQGMAPGAAMSFVLAGGVSSIPAAIAVWALVKPRVFAGYIGLAFIGALIAGVVWGAIA
ncbi:MAG: permease [Planctomycetota bacterium]